MTSKWLCNGDLINSQTWEQPTEHQVSRIRQIPVRGGEQQDYLPGEDLLHISLHGKKAESITLAIGLTSNAVKKLKNNTWIALDHELGRHLMNLSW